MTDHPTGVQGPPSVRGPIKGPVRIVFGIIKGLCILSGLPLTILCLMALMGLITGNGWARSIVAIVVAIALPLVLVDRLLPDEGQERARGLPTDMLALIWMVVPVIFIGAAHGATQGVMAVEGDRLGAAGWTRISQAAYWLAAVEPVSPKVGGGGSTGSGGTRAAGGKAGKAGKAGKDGKSGAATPAAKGTKPGPVGAKADAGASAGATRDGGSPPTQPKNPMPSPRNSRSSHLPSSSAAAPRRWSASRSRAPGAPAAGLASSSGGTAPWAPTRT